MEGLHDRARDGPGGPETVGDPRWASFLQRAYDQLIHDVALQNLDVTFVLDRAGLVGADGATHAGNYDIAYLRCIPNMIVMAASDDAECRAAECEGIA